MKFKVITLPILLLLISGFYSNDVCAQCRKLQNKYQFYADSVAPYAILDDQDGAIFFLRTSNIEGFEDLHRSVLLYLFVDSALDAKTFNKISDRVIAMDILYSLDTVLSKPLKGITFPRLVSYKGGYQEDNSFLWNSRCLKFISFVPNGQRDVESVCALPHVVNLELQEYTGDLPKSENIKAPIRYLNLQKSLNKTDIKVLSQLGTLVLLDVTNICSEAIGKLGDLESLNSIFINEYVGNACNKLSSYPNVNVCNCDE